MDRGRDKERQKKKRKRKHSSSSSSSSDSSSSRSSSSSSSHERYSSYKKKRRKKNVRKHKTKKDISSDSSSERDTQHKHKRKKKKSKSKKKKKKKEKKKRHGDKEQVQKAPPNLKPAVEASCPEVIDTPILPKADPSETSGKKRSMVPMTKEEYEKSQSVVRRVLDPETGRSRLVKGDGEILEEIVSYSRHKQINQQATKADGQYFEARVGLHHR